MKPEGFIHSKMPGIKCRTLLHLPLSYGHLQVVNAEIRLIILFAAKDGKALYSQQKQGLTVAQIMNSLLTNSD